jgi:acyl-homoserine-lactone acylase
MYKTILLALISFMGFSQKFTKNEVEKWKEQAQNVTITRDNWGIPHIEGVTDADAVFGLMYAQCEDDFKRIELNYLEKLGRLSEIYGESKLYDDLQIRILIKESDAKADYKNAQPWMKKLLDSFAAGMNYYLYTHPETTPKLLTRFEPWYPLLWTDGSIGAISTADLSIGDLKAFYAGESKVGAVKKVNEDYEQTGSNGFAIAPKLSKSGYAMLYINPHTTFYFRPEVHVKSGEGLNAYGAVTWGQFFIYQGFNPYCGWMHTSSNADVADTYLEKVTTRKNKLYYQYENTLKPIKTEEIQIKYLENNKLKAKNFKEYTTHHGPIMAIEGDNWVSLKSYNRAAKSLEQSWIRTKATGMQDYMAAMDLKANTSNNTVFADNKGNIAYWHGNYMPIRDFKLNWSKPVDGSTKDTEYKGLHEVSETVHVYNPENGWIQNCNSTPFTSAGNNSPVKTKYPAYMAPDGENFRGVNATRLLSKVDSINLDELIKLGYDNFLPAFEVLIPGFVEKTKDKVDLEIMPIRDMFKDWDYRVDENSIEALLAIEWAQRLNPSIRKIYVDQGEMDQVESTKYFIANASSEELIAAMRDVINTLKKNFGTWGVTWGEVNRFQRLNNNIPTENDDSQPSLAMRNASALWGCLPSFNSKTVNGSKKRYGYSGNSFVCAVEFGERIKAKSLLAGGVSGDVNSKNFNDQAEMFVNGQFKDVLFYPEDIEKNAVRKYNPGQ